MYALFIRPVITGEGMLSEMNAIQQAVIIGMYNDTCTCTSSISSHIFVSSIKK